MYILKLLSEPKKCFLLVAVLFSYNLIKGVRTHDADSNQTTDLNENASCEKDDSQYTTLLVGVISTFVFCLIGVFPALFIRTEDDVEKFSKPLNLKFMQFTQITFIIFYRKFHVL
jgi:hypothetical protein